MKLGVTGGVIAVLLFAAVVVGYSSLFSVYQTQQALVVRLGQPVRVVNEPGLHAKAPFIDNVIAIAGAADGHIGLVAFGIVISVPIIVWGSKLVLALMDRFPLVMVLGSALLGWVGGALWLGDAYLAPRLGQPPQWAHLGSAAIGAVLVVAIGKLLAQHRGGS